MAHGPRRHQWLPQLAASHSQLWVKQAGPLTGAVKDLDRALDTEPENHLRTAKQRLKWRRQRPEADRAKERKRGVAVSWVCEFRGTGFLIVDLSFLFFFWGDYDPLLLYQEGGRAPIPCESLWLLNQRT